MKIQLASDHVLNMNDAVAGAEVMLENQKSTRRSSSKSKRGMKAEGCSDSSAARSGQRRPPKEALPGAHGKASLAKLYRGQTAQGLRPLLFLDFDEVICLNNPYGGYDLFAPAADWPADLFERLWHSPALQTLLAIVDEHRPQIVITTSWLRLMQRDGFQSLFLRTGLEVVATSLHEKWKAPQDRGASRHRAIEVWLNANHRGQRPLVLDDHLSGTGFRGSKLDRAGCVILCDEGVGLHAGHLAAACQALGSVR